ncbi:bro1 domain-containing protein brox [Anaeramoeba ignava]|uniref:Bro1 domain-containing protein brox n=1 Tax=Anaeramoeba ignava TaxID=1746090 RepID=A0A9Q0R7A6_ANAIG|nr:bro1 domain-containing protein brox [Anaeramoeba ignava]
MFFRFPLPKPKKFSFETLFKFNKQNKQNKQILIQITQKRTELQKLSEMTIPSAIEQTQNYLSLILGLRNSVNNLEKIQLKTLLKLYWKSSSTQSTNYFPIVTDSEKCSKGLSLDISMVLNLIAILYLNYGISVFEKAEELEKDRVANDSIKYFQKSAGIFSKMAEEIESNGDPPQVHPPEFVPLYAKGMNLLSRSFANYIAMKKGELSDTKPMILAKLCIGSQNLIEQAEKTFKEKDTEWNSFSLAFQSYLPASKLIFYSMACKFLAQHFATKDKLGIALGYLEKATNYLKTIPKSTAINFASKIQNRIAEEVKDISRLKETYERTNTTVFLQNVVPIEDLPKLPDGLELAKETPFSLPKPPFSNLILI